VCHFLGQAFEGGRRDLPQVLVDTQGAVHVAAFGGRYNRYVDGEWAGVKLLGPESQEPVGYADLAMNDRGEVWVAYEKGPDVDREEVSGESEILLKRLSARESEFGETVIPQWGTAEWSVMNPIHQGNPFDVQATVTFTHSVMFASGD